MSTTIHHLIFRPNVSLERDASGLLWRDALTELAAGTGWRQMIWGRHMETPDKVLLMIDWGECGHALVCLRELAPAFVQKLEPLLALYPPEPPTAANLLISNVEPVASPDGQTMVSSVFRYNLSGLSADKRAHVHSMHLYPYLQTLYGMGDGGIVDGFQTGDTCLTMDPETADVGAELYMLLHWDTLEAEQHSERELVVEKTRETYYSLCFDAVRREAGVKEQKFHVQWQLLRPEDWEGFLRDGTTFNDRLRGLGRP